MSVLYVILPVALIVAACAVGAFIWATRAGQFDDLETPALRMLHDDEARRGEAQGIKDTRPRSARKSSGSG